MDWIETVREQNEKAKNNKATLRRKMLQKSSLQVRQLFAAAISDGSEQEKKRTQAAKKPKPKKFENDPGEALFLSLLSERTKSKEQEYCTAQSASKRKRGRRKLSICSGVNAGVLAQVHSMSGHKMREQLSEFAEAHVNLATAAGIDVPKFSEIALRNIYSRDNDCAKNSVGRAFLRWQQTRALPLRMHFGVVQHAWRKAEGSSDSVPKTLSPVGFE